MKINEMFSSKYLKAADLGGKQYTVVVDRVLMEKIVEEEPEKACIYFSGSDKGMVLNKTNALELASVYGEDTDLWVGKPVVLFTQKTQFQGKVVDGLRLRVDAAQAHPEPPPPLTQEEQPVQSGPPAGNPDDDLPF